MIIICREESFRIRTPRAEVKIASCDGAYRTVHAVPVGFVIDTFPTVLLIIKLQCGAVGHHDEVVQGIAR